jgi:hypothetical protein
VYNFENTVHNILTNWCIGPFSSYCNITTH